MVKYNGIHAICVPLPLGLLHGCQSSWTIQYIHCTTLILYDLFEFPLMQLSCNRKIVILSNFYKEKYCHKSSHNANIIWINISTWKYSSWDKCFLILWTMVVIENRCILLCGYKSITTVPAFVVCDDFVVLLRPQRNAKVTKHKRPEVFSFLSSSYFIYLWFHQVSYNKEKSGKKIFHISVHLPCNILADRKFDTIKNDKLFIKEVNIKLSLQ